MNKEILLKANAAIATGDYEAFLSYCTKDTHWTFAGEQILQGKQAVLDYLKATYLVPPKLTVDNLIAENDFLVAHGSISLKETSGIWTDYLYCDVWRIAEGKLASLKAFVVTLK